MDLNFATHTGPRFLSANRIPILQRTAALQDRPAEDGQTILVGGLAILLTFGVLAFGSVDQWAISILEVGSALLLLVWIWQQISLGRLHFGTNPLYLPTILYGVIIIVQVVFRLSAYVYVTSHELWKYGCYGALFLLASHCRRAAVQKLLAILAVFGFIVALFALVQDLTYNGKIFWVEPTVFRAFGSYFNSNHYAGLMEMLTPIALAMALTAGTTWSCQPLWTIAGVLMAATIFVCGSRGGMIAFAVQMVVLAVCVVARKRRRTAWALLAICFLIGSFVLWIDNGTLLNRLEILRNPLTNADVTSRLTIARDSLQMVRERPIIGWGLGLFPLVYPQYRSFSTDLVVNQAHNDYVQVLVETGILGFACVLWFMVNLYRTGLPNLRAHSRVTNLRALGPLVGCTGILVHSFSDFNLHIPANAALFFVFCGIASGGNTGRGPEEGARDHDEIRHVGSACVHAA